MKKIFLIICFLLIGQFIFALNDLDDLLKQVYSVYAKVYDYTCTMDKEELVNGKMIVMKGLLYKHRKPASFYIKLPDGREVIYFEGKYNNELQINTLINLSLDPRGSLAMKNGRHPVPESDMGTLLTKIKKNYAKAKAQNEGQITLEKEEMLNGRKAQLIKSVFPKDKGYYAHIIYLFIDDEMKLPIKVVSYGWENELWENYYFYNLKTNTGLTDSDFDKKNPAYDF